MHSFKQLFALAHRTHSYSSLVKRSLLNSTRLRTSITRCRSTAAEAATIPAPHLEGDEKEFPPKIQRIVEDISQLTLLEVADLNELLKKTLNIQDAPIMAMGSAAAPKEEEEEAEAPKKEKTAFSVKITQFDAAKKIALIKEIKNVIEGMNLVQSKKFVESLPQVVKAELGKDDAEKLKTVLEASGATVELE